MIREPAAVLDEVRTAVRDGSGESLSVLLVELTAGLCAHARFPADAFERVVSLLGDPAYWAHADGWELVKELDSSWELLTVEQRAELWPLLVAGFDKGASPMGAFVIGELLGGRYGGEAALEALSSLAASAAMPARALVPHGLETLARGTQDAALKRRTVSRLRELKMEGCNDVREEACIALRNVGVE